VRSRSPAFVGHLGAPGRHPAEDRPGAPWALHHRDHARYLQPREPGHGRRRGERRGRPHQSPADSQRARTRARPGAAGDTRESMPGRPCEQLASFGADAGRGEAVLGGFRTAARRTGIASPQVPPVTDRVTAEATWRAAVASRTNLPFFCSRLELNRRDYREGRGLPGSGITGQGGLSCQLRREGAEAPEGDRGPQRTGWRTRWTGVSCWCR